jgi:hypothetical protein
MVMLCIYCKGGEIGISITRNGLAMKRSRIVSSKLTKQIQMITKNATLKKDRNSAMFYSFCYVAFILWNTKW